MTVADLGLRIDSSQAKGAKADLDAFSAASGKAEAAAEKLGRASAKANADMAKISAAVTQANTSLDKLVAEAGQSNAAFQKLIATVEQTNIAIEKLGKAAPPKLPNPKPFNDGLGDTNRIGRQTSQMFLNLSRQGNDVVTMFALGAAPMQIFASQAGQIYDALESGPGGLRGSLKAIGESLLSVAARFPLATAAVAAAGAAFVIYKTASGDKVQELDEILGAHKKIIEGLGDGWDKAADRAKNYVRESTEAGNLALGANAKEQAKRAAADVADAVKQMQAAIFAETSKTGGMVVESRFAPFYDLIDRLRDGKVKVTEFRTELARMASANPALLATAEELSKITDKAKETEIAVSGTRKEITAAEANVLAFQDALAKVDADPIRKALQDIFDKAKGGVEPLAEIELAIARLQQANPSFSGIIAGFRDMIKAAYDASAAIDTVMQGGQGSPNGRGKLPVGILPDAAPVPGQRPNAEDIGAENDKRLARLARSGARAGNAYRDLIKNADDRIKQMQTELDLLGQVGVKADALRNYQELLSRATDHGRTVGEKQQKELRARAEAMAQLEDATKKAKVQQDLLFERQQLLRTPTDQLIADTMRSAGLEVDFNSPIAGAIRFNEQISQTRDLLEGIGQDITSGLTQALEDGKLEWKELGDIALNALSRIADKLIDMAMDQMISGLLGSLFGGGGGLGIFPGGGGVNSTVGLWAKGGAFANGISGFSNTIVDRATPFRFANGAGIMGEAGPEGILPLRRNSQGQLGVIAAGAANNNQPANYNDNRVYNIDARGAQQGVGVEIRKALADYDRNLPNRMQQIQADPRGR